MDWIKINKNTLKAFIRKNNIVDVLINRRTEWDGMIDGTRQIDVNIIISAEQFLKEVNVNNYSIQLYLTDNGLFACSSHRTYYVIDEQFIPFIDLIKMKKMVEKL